MLMCDVGTLGIRMGKMGHQLQIKHKNHFESNSLEQMRRNTIF